MWYWRQKNYEGLLDIANAVEGNANLFLYAEYCRLRERGLRRDAFLVLNEFIELANTWDLEMRYRFVDDLYHLCEQNPEVYDLMPHPINRNLLEPTLQDWVKENPNDPSVYRWLSGVENWRKSIALDETEQISRVRLVKHLIYNAYFSTHHLPEGYIGNPAEDLMGLNEASALVTNVENTALVEIFRTEIKDYRELIHSYQEYRKSSYVGSFEAWTELYKRRGC